MQGIMGGEVGRKSNIAGPIEQVKFLRQKEVSKSEMDLWGKMNLD